MTSHTQAVAERIQSEFATPSDVFSRGAAVATQAQTECATLAAKLELENSKHSASVTAGKRTAQRIETEIDALTSECKDAEDGLEVLERRVQVWRDPLRVTLLQLSKLREARDFMTGLQSLGERANEYDKLGDADVSTRVSKLHDMAELSNLAAEGSTLSVAAAKLLVDRSQKLKTTLVSQLTEALDNASWPTVSLSSPSASNWARPFGLLIQLQTNAWRSRPIETRSESGLEARSLWAMSTLVQPLLRRFEYHFCTDGRPTCRIDCPEWMFSFIFKVFDEHKETMVHLQTACCQNGLNEEMCHAPSEFIRPLLDVLQSRLRVNMRRLQDQLGDSSSSVAARGLHLVEQRTEQLLHASGERASAVLGSLQDLKDGSKAIDMLTGLSASIAAAQQVVRPLQSSSASTDDNKIDCDTPAQHTSNDAQASTIEAKISMNSSADRDPSHSSIDYNILFAHYVNEILQFESKLQKILDYTEGDNELEFSEASGENDESFPINCVGTSVVGRCLLSVLAKPEWASMMWIRLELATATDIWRDDDEEIEESKSIDGGAVLKSLPRLFEALANFSERLQLIPDRKTSRHFVQAVHVGLVASAHGSLEARLKGWQASSIGFGLAKPRATADSLLQLCAIHNSASFCTGTLSTWQDSLFYLTLVSSTATHAFFSDWVDAFQHIGKLAIEKLANYICDEIKKTLHDFVDSSRSLYCITNADQFSATMVSDELKPLLAKLTGMLQRCKIFLRSRTWPQFWRSVARRMDRDIFDQLLCDREPPICTREGVQVLSADLHAIFAVFGDTGQRQFRLTSETLLLLSCPANELEALQQALDGETSASGHSPKEELAARGITTMSVHEARLTQGVWPRQMQ